MKQVLITGGATGIGAATAQVFLERGYRVFVTVHQTAAELPGVTAIPCDITDPAAVERLQSMSDPPNSGYHAGGL